MNNMTMKLDGITFKTGDRITCTINRIKIKDAKIYILTPQEIEGCYIDDEDCMYDCGHRAIYICNNQRNNNDFEDLDPDDRNDKKKYLGYKKIWSCIVRELNDINNGVKKIELYKEPYVSPYDNFIKGIDNLALSIDEFVEQDFVKFHEAVGE
jgi:hypothetical protein